MDIGNQIRERRQRLGLSQDELAQKLYVSRVTVSHWETGRTLPDVQSMLLLANLFGTTIDEMVRGDVDEMREMVEKGEQQRKAFAIALGAVEVTVIAVLSFMATAGRDYLDSALRLLLAVLVLASAVVVLVARRQEGGCDARSAAELLGAASGDPVEAARESASAQLASAIDLAERSSDSSPAGDDPISSVIAASRAATAPGTMLRFTCGPSFPPNPTQLEG